MFDPGGHQGLELAEAVVGQRGGNALPELGVVPEIGMGKSLAGGEEAVHVQRFAAQRDGVVVGDDRPAGLGSGEGVTERRVDQAKAPAPPPEPVWPK